MFRHLFIAIFLILSSGLYAQKPATVQRKQIPDSLKTNKLQVTDSLKVQRKQVPDSVKKPRILREWTLSKDYTEEINLPIDTIFSLSNRFKLADKYSPVNATLGNYGLPFYQISFFDRITDPDKYLYTYYYPLMWLPDKALFMNTQVPFTELDWTFAGPRETSEQTFRVRHSQNINRFLNFGAIYDITYSLGQYNYQRAEDKDFILYSSYTGDKYKVYFAAGINNQTAYENGGITNDTTLSQQKNTRDVPVVLGGLDKAKSMLKNRNILLVQRYTLSSSPAALKDSTAKKRSGFFGLSGTLSHIFIYETNNRTYVDAYPKSGLYDTSYISTSATNDSLYSRSIKNTLRFDFTTDPSRKFRLGGGFGIRNELFRFSQIIPTHDTTRFHSPDTLSVLHKSSNALVAKLFNNIGDKFGWEATGELYVTGYRAGDFNLNGDIIKSFLWKKGKASWLITGSMANRQPSFWFQHWGSNNFEWNVNLKKEFRIDVGSKFLYPARSTEIKINYAIIKNYTDFDSTKYPSQYSGGLSVAALTVRKDLRAWKFHLTSDVIIQKSSNSSILDLPLLTLRSAGYFEYFFRFKQTGGKLNTQLGFDVTYNTAYHPYSYIPATGRFYRQSLVTEGNYPFINVFLNFKVKRTRAFIIFDHVNSGLMGYRYDMVPLYPMNIRMLRYGLAWTFYD